jgi:hypothetical protein
MLALLLFASPALAAPKLDNLSVKANSKSPEVEIAITVIKSGVGTCDARVEFGDGRGRSVDFGVATIRSLKYTYAKGGNYKVSVKGTGKTPCEGAREVAVNVTGPAAKKAEQKAEQKAEKKKAEKKKADKKSASAKKEEPK